MLPGLGDESKEPVKVVPLRRLLSAMTVLLLIGASGFLLWNLSAGITEGAALLFLLVLLLGAAATVLFTMKDPSVQRLRNLERVVFAALTAYLAWMAYDSFGRLLAGGDVEGLVSRWNLTLTQFVLLMVAYGTAIPNAWQRAARVIGALALTPVAVIAGLWASGPDHAAGLRAIATPARLVESALVLMIGASLAVMAAYVIDQYLNLAGTTRLSIRYMLKNRIGMGGMGEVWLAEHNLLARPAAVKLIRGDAIEKEDPARATRLLRRFEREARATARLRSVHTVEVYDFGVTDNGIFYYAMELLDGIDLKTLVEEYGPVPAPRAVYLLTQACHSLADAHAQGMTHRDIKPANIFICRLGTAHDFVKVLDFGLVTVGDVGEIDPGETTDVSIDGELQGTPGYMAPELVHGSRRADGRNDIYSLGCVAYFLLTGTPVFEGPPLSVMVDHVKTAPEPPSRRTELEIPEQLEAVILRCLQKDPSDRYQSAEELAEALQEAGPEPRWGAREAAEWWRLHLPVPSSRRAAS